MAKLSNEFEAQVVTSPELKKEVFKIRHQVYCEEFAFERINAQAMEVDEFDEHSIFSMIKHKPSGLYTSCVRVVKIYQQQQRLPVEKFFLDAISLKDYLPENFPRDQICEVSRLAVTARFRRILTRDFINMAIAAGQSNNSPAPQYPLYPFISIGLYMAAGVVALNSGAKHIYALMEPKFARYMRFMGIYFKQLGEPIEHQGYRAVYYISAEVFFQSLHPPYKNLFYEIKQRLIYQLDILQD
jgi:N-acyl amino acid synthase of PEP-CTERM/exosortase system